MDEGKKPKPPGAAPVKLDSIDIKLDLSFDSGTRVDVPGKGVFMPGEKKTDPARSALTILEPLVPAAPETARARGTQGTLNFWIARVLFHLRTPLFENRAR